MLLLPDILPSDRYDLAGLVRLLFLYRCDDSLRLLVKSSYNIAYIPFTVDNKYYRAYYNYRSGTYARTAVVPG